MLNSIDLINDFEIMLGISHVFIHILHNISTGIVCVYTLYTYVSIYCVYTYIYIERESAKDMCACTHLLSKD